jgi:3-methyladenine DNA glycosylase AlkC
MPQPLKDRIDAAFLAQLTRTFETCIPGFDSGRFQRAVLDGAWEEKELKARIRHMAVTLRSFLPESYEETVELLLLAVRHLQTTRPDVFGFGYMLFPELVEVYGLDDLDTSVRALEQITPLASAEFAVRPFLLRHPERMLQQMRHWAEHPDPHVRRLASEGCRPRLPWAVALPFLKKDPSPILPILEVLKADPSEYVRRSVANNLNDIAKDHPEVVLAVAERWKGSHPDTDRLLKHACRTLLKKAHPKALAHFGFEETAVKIQALSLGTPALRIGETLPFQFELLSVANQPAQLRIEYAIDYVKARGGLSRKVFQLTENTFPAHQPIRFSRTQRFCDFTTRKHYPGEHRLAILVNGQELASQPFELLPAEAD